MEALAGYSYQDFYTYSPFRFGYKADGSRMNPLEPAQNPFKTQYTLLSYYGRVNYTFKRAVPVHGHATGRRLVALQPQKPLGLLPGRLGGLAHQPGSVSGRRHDPVSDLKLRLSYGSTGQQDITGVAGDYPYLAKYSISSPVNSQIFGNDTIRTL